MPSRHASSQLPRIGTANTWTQTSIDTTKPTNATIGYGRAPASAKSHDGYSLPRRRPRISVTSSGASVTMTPICRPFSMRPASMNDV